MPSGSWSRIVAAEQVVQLALGGRLDGRAPDDQLDPGGSGEVRAHPLDDLGSDVRLGGAGQDAAIDLDGGVTRDDVVLDARA